MKCRNLFCLMMTLFLFLTACGRDGSNPNVYEHDGYTIDMENRTITQGEDVYTYAISGNARRSKITITYPNGATYFWEWSGNSGAGGWSDDYDPDRYTDGDTLMELINFKPESEKSGPSPLLAILVLAAGIFNLVSPRTVWYLSYGWRFKNAEPSDAVLIVNRLGGGVIIFIGIILFLA